MKPCYHKYLSINTFNNDGTGNTKLKEFLNEAFKTSTSGTTHRPFNQLNTFKTEGNISHPQLKKPGQDNKPGTDEYFAKLDGLWGDPIYFNNTTDQNSSSNIIEKYLIKNMDTYFKKIGIRKLPQHHTRTQGLLPPYRNLQRSLLISRQNKPRSIWIIHRNNLLTHTQTKAQATEYG